MKKINTEKINNIQSLIDKEYAKELDIIKSIVELDSKIFENKMLNEEFTPHEVMGMYNSVLNSKKQELKDVVEKIIALKKDLYREIAGENINSSEDIKFDKFNLLNKYLKDVKVPQDFTIDKYRMIPIEPLQPFEPNKTKRDIINPPNITLEDIDGGI